MARGVSKRAIHAPSRRRFAAALLVSAALVASAPQAAHASASPKERRFASMVNATRGTATLSSMKLSNHLSDVARKHSKHMANKGELYHSNLERLLGPGVTAVGENVGFGGSLDDLLKAFLASPPHAENLLGDYRQTGVGIVRADGQIWITQVFAA